MDPEFEGSCRSLTNVMSMIEREYGIPMPDRNGRRLLECIKEQIDAAIREECRRAAEEGAYRAFRLADEVVVKTNPNGLYIRAAEVRINAGNVGLLQLRPFRGGLR